MHNPRCLCGAPLRDRYPNSRCRRCHAEYMRTYRRLNPLVGEAKYRARARAYARTYLKRGLLTRKPCERCGEEDAPQMHHADYSKPLQVIWLCELCHENHHSYQRRGIVTPKLY